MLKKFEGVFVKLIDQLIFSFEVNPDETFEQFNMTSA